MSLLIALCSTMNGRQAGSNKNTSGGAPLRIIASPDLYDLSKKWAEEYNRQSEGPVISVINAADPEKTGDLIRQGELAVISGEYAKSMKDGDFWNVIVGRDVIVPVINARNPLLEEIVSRGVSPASLSGFLGKGGSGSWGDLLGNGSKEKAAFFCIGDKLALSSLSSFLNTDEEAALGAHHGSAGEVLSAIAGNPLSFGFCRLTDVLDDKTQILKEGIRFLPLDRNGNGHIDFSEDIYDNAAGFARGVWIGKYPRALIGNVYALAREQPANAPAVAFIRWILSDGQKYLPLNGYSELLANERQSASDKINNPAIVAGASAGEKNLLASYLMLAAFIILSGVAAWSLSGRRKHETITGGKAENSDHPVLDSGSIRIPKGMYFDKTHTWAFLEETGNVRVGIDDFLQHITGKITRIRMKEPGRKVKKGEQILSIVQNGKQLNLYAPVSGTIVEQNTALEDNSSPLNSSPYKDGWIYRIEPSNWSRESQLLFMAEKHRDFLKMEFSRLKDFLSKALAGDANYAQVLLQDGGEIRDGVLSDMGPEVWEDFQSDFIDPSRQVWFYEIF